MMDNTDCKSFLVRLAESYNKRQTTIVNKK